MPKELLMILLVYLLIINAVTFLVYAADKRKAKNGKLRVPEKTLFLLAGIGGSIGALLGMQVLRHKTKHMSFVIGIPLILIVQILLAAGIWFLIYNR